MCMGDAYVSNTLSSAQSDFKTEVKARQAEVDKVVAQADTDRAHQIPDKMILQAYLLSVYEHISQLNNCFHP